MPKNQKPANFTARVVLNGRITIPDELRKIWYIEDGDMVELGIINVCKATEITPKPKES